ncbi:MAG: CvpA family protein [Lachnospiraceae bacterium]|nr:CvpA family protein [Lachnospiraceae bacterium]
METVFVLAGSALIVIGFGIFGCYRGFVRMIFSFASFFLTVFLVWQVYPYVNNFLGTTSLMQTITEKSVKYVQTELTEKLVSDPQGGGPESVEKTGDQLLDESWLSVVQKFAEMAKEEVEEAKSNSVSDVSNHIGGLLARLIIKVIAFTITFALIRILLQIIYSLLKIVTMLPVIHTLNKTAGAVLGLVQGIIVIWILMLVAIVFFNTTIGAAVLRTVNENNIFATIYNTNPLLWLLIRG